MPNQDGLAAAPAIPPLAISGLEAFATTDPSLTTAWSRLRLTVDGTLAYLWADAGNGGTSLPLSVQVGGAERLRITIGGNVGIGTPTPGALLDVPGTVRLAGSGNTSLWFSTADQASGTWLRNDGFATVLSPPPGTCTSVTSAPARTCASWAAAPPPR